eukprot:5360374-Prorocentrum_lima.AAC.1
MGPASSFWFSSLQLGVQAGLWDDGKGALPGALGQSDVSVLAGHALLPVPVSYTHLRAHETRRHL